MKGKVLTSTSSKWDILGMGVRSLFFWKKNFHKYEMSSKYIVTFLLEL
jgi:hypothetical protein